jgi:hypothetical protein
MQFHQLVYRLVLVEKRISVKALAPLLGMTSATLYKSLNGKGDFSPDQVRILLRELKDIRLAAWFLLDTNYVPIERAEFSPNEIGAIESLRRTALVMMIEAAEAAREVDAALCDERIDHREAVQIRADIEAAERAIVTLREHVPSMTN